MSIEETVCGELVRGVEEVLPTHELEKKLKAAGLPKEAKAKADAEAQKAAEDASKKQVDDFKKLFGDVPATDAPKPDAIKAADTAADAT